MDELRPPEEDANVIKESEQDAALQLLTMIDNFGANVANYYNQGWRQELVERQTNPQIRLERDMFLAAMINDVAKAKGSNVRISAQSIENYHKNPDPQRQSADDKAFKEMWSALTGNSVGQNQKFAMEVEEKYKNILQGAEDKAIDPEADLTSQLTTIRLPHAEDGTSQYSAEEISRLLE